MTTMRLSRVMVCLAAAAIPLGALADVGVSPTPPGASGLFTKCVSTAGHSFIRIGR